MSIQFQLCFKVSDINLLDELGQSLKWENDKIPETNKPVGFLGSPYSWESEVRPDLDWNHGGHLLTLMVALALFDHFW